MYIFPSHGGNLEQECKVSKPKYSTDTAFMGPPANLSVWFIPAAHCPKNKNLFYLMSTTSFQLLQQHGKIIADLKKKTNQIKNQTNNTFLSEKKQFY